MALLMGSDYLSLGVVLNDARSSSNGCEHIRPLVRSLRVSGAPDAHTSVHGPYTTTQVRSQPADRALWFMVLHLAPHYIAPSYRMGRPSRRATFVYGMPIGEACKHGFESCSTLDSTVCGAYRPVYALYRVVQIVVCIQY